MGSLAKLVIGSLYILKPLMLKNLHLKGKKKSKLGKAEK